jgi:hypothetical protein
MVVSKKVLPKEVEVTRSSIQGYTEVMKKRYRGAGKRVKVNFRMNTPK